MLPTCHRVANEAYLGNEAIWKSLSRGIAVCHQNLVVPLTVVVGPGDVVHGPHHMRLVISNSNRGIGAHPYLQRKGSCLLVRHKSWRGVSTEPHTNTNLVPDLYTDGIEVLVKCSIKVPQLRHLLHQVLTDGVPVQGHVAGCHSIPCLQCTCGLVQVQTDKT